MDEIFWFISYVAGYKFFVSLLKFLAVNIGFSNN